MAQKRGQRSCVTDDGAVSDVKESAAIVGCSRDGARKGNGSDKCNSDSSSTLALGTRGTVWTACVARARHTSSTVGDRRAALRGKDKRAAQRSAARGERRTSREKKKKEKSPLALIKHHT